LKGQSKKNCAAAPGTVEPGTGADCLPESAFLKACRREPCPYTPVWLMRQAGRYMKEYRQIRHKVGFLELCKTPELACQVTVHAQETLAADAAIIFADILLPLDALGVGLEFVKGGGPLIARPVRSHDDLKRLAEIEASESLAYVLESVRLTRRALKNNIPLIGFAGAPFTLASYLVEGSYSRNWEHTKTMMYRCPALWHELMTRLVLLSIKYLNAQAEAGAQALQIFDSWVGSLSPADYREYVLPYSKQLIAGLAPGRPIIYFGTGNASLLPLMKEAGAAVMGLDWRVDLKLAWNTLGDLAVQGNLDPCVLLADREFIKLKAEELLAAAGGRPGHIFNLGHGILPLTDVDKVKYLVELVHTYRSNFERSELLMSRGDEESAY
jgi:uroporphyrinogen decarboxylase